MGCKKAQGFLAAQEYEVMDQSDAGKERLGPERALELAKAAEKVVVGRGKKVAVIDMKTETPDDQTLLSYLLGPTGDLRAPTLRRGKTLLVGFSEEAYRQILGKKVK
jgi:arsenate reductase-like glutaredoxin family protein